jgi:hypothetical protein
MFRSYVGANVSALSAMRRKKCITVFGPTHTGSQTRAITNEDKRRKVSRQRFSQRFEAYRWCAVTMSRGAQSPAPKVHGRCPSKKLGYARLQMAPSVCRGRTRLPGRPQVASAVDHWQTTLVGHRELELGNIKGGPLSGPSHMPARWTNLKEVFFDLRLKSRHARAGRPRIRVMLARRAIQVPSRRVGPASVGPASVGPTSVGPRAGSR